MLLIVNMASPPLRAPVAVPRPGHVLALEPRDDTGTDLDILRQLDGDIAQKLVEITWRNRTRGLHHGEFGIGE